MTSKHIINKFSYSLVNKEENKYFLYLNGRRYYVGQFVIEILELLKRQKSYHGIALELNKNHNTDFFNELSIQQTIEVDFIKQGILQDEIHTNEVINNHKNYIYGRINFLNPQNFPQVLNFLSYLFTPVLIIGISILSVIITVLFLIQQYETIIHSKSYSFPVLLFLFVFSIANTFWHEMGHATAAYRFGVNPKDIGFGFYIVYPIFFTDVSDIWQLNNNQRNLVNLGGIYFQIIANLILISLYYISPVFWIVPILVTLNTGVALISLNPFFRYDGYWVYADFFKLTNLRSQSNTFIKTFFKKIIGQESRNWKELFSMPKSLIFYSFTSTIFFVIIFTFLLLSCIEHISVITEIIRNIHITGWTNEIFWSISTKAFTVIMLPIFIIWSFVQRKK